MKILTLFSLAAAATSVPMSLTSPVLGPVWQGPRQTVLWQGFSATAYGSGSGKKVAKTLPAQTLPAAGEASDDTPRWIGYYRRGPEWWVRVELSSGKSEMLHRGGATSDGWQLTALQAQANRPTSITLSRNGVDKTLTLSTPQQH